MSKTTVRFWMLGMGVLLLAGCDKDGHDSDETAGDTKSTGQIQLPLISGGSSGNTYRLRDGEFVITALETDESIVVSTEENLNEESIDISLGEGPYTVFLRPGYYLEKLPEDTAMDTEIDPLAGAGERRAQCKGAECSRVEGYRGRAIKSKRALADIDIDDEESDTEDVDTEDTDGGETDPDVVLISDNPLFVEVERGYTTRAVFIFQLGGEIINGTLSILFEVIEQATCTDEYEPNNDEASASVVDLTTPITATVCNDDLDFYTFDPGVAEGDYFQIDVLFSGAVSDIDIELMDSEGDIVAGSYSVSDNETVVTQSNGEPYTLIVYPFSPEANEYEVVLILDPELSNCCETSPLAGCTIPEVEACICDIDSWCCEVDFDDVCLEISFMECAVSCPLGEGDCCEAAETPGCDDQDIQDCVCSADSFCCTDAYDPYCAELAMAACGLQCETLPPDSDCCEVGEAPGCTDSDVNDCVCGVDPICCAHPFDENCVQLAIGICGAQC